MKRLFTRLLLVTLLTVLGTTLTWAQKSVLDESFSSGSLPKGWTQAQQFWKFEDGNASFFALAENEPEDMLISPVLSLSELKNVPSVAITYSNFANGDHVNELKVLYRAGSSGEWSQLQDFTAATTGQESWKGALPGSLSSVQIAIAAKYLLGGETHVYRISVENRTEATDAPTHFKVEELTTTTAQLGWDECTSSEFVQYNVKVNSYPMEDMSLMGDIVDASTTDQWFDLTKLQPDTKYWCYVQYDCGYGDVSPWAELQFQTPCLAIQAPYSENFEEGLTDCYTIIKDGSASEVSGDYAYNSQKSFKSESGKGKYNYLFLPALDQDVKNYQVSFMAAGSETGNTYARTVTVGVSTDLTKENFTGTITLNLPKGRQWESITISLKDYSGTGRYIAFKFGNEDKENHIFIDNIKVERQKECPLPLFLTASAITDKDAQLDWTKAGNETEWNLVLSTKPLSDPEEIVPDAEKGEYAGSISEKPYTATNLQPNTTYFAYLQLGNSCNNWTNAVQFKTTRAVEYPYVEHFDRMKPDAYDETTTNAIPDNWVMDDRCITSGTNFDKQYSGTTYRPFVTTKQNHDQTAYVNAALKLAGASSTGYMSIAMLPAMPKAVNTMMITFWAKAENGNQTLKVGVANTQTNELPQGKQLGVNITEVGQATIIKNEWKQYKVLLTNYTGEGRYITLAPGAPYAGTPYIYIDDIVVDDAPDCNAVSTLTAEATGIDKATATWTDASSSTSWTIKVSSTEIDPSSANGDIVAAQTVNAKSYDITGLAMGQTYYVYVSPTCGDAWMSTSVTTLVGLQVPYYNDFTNETTGANANRGPKNWKLGYTYTDTPGATSSNWPHVNTTAWTNAPADVAKNSVYFNNSYSASSQFPYAIMPELLNADVKDLKMSFYAYWNNAKPSSPANYACVNDSYYGVLKIGVVNSPSDISKANAFKNVTEVAAVRCKGPKEAEYFVVDMSAYTGSGKYIVFYQDTAKSNYMMLDNLSITLATDPQKITDLVVSAKDETTATLTWTENGKAAKWEVKVFAEAPEDVDAATPIFTQTVTAKEVTVTGLTHSTQYFAYVRSIQNNGNGAWGSLAFYSECGAWAVPFYEDWNSYPTGNTSTNTFHPCYNVEHSTASTWPYVRLYTGASSYHPSQSNFLCMSAGTNKVCQLEFPKLNAPINTLQMEMEAQAYSSYAGAKYITFFGVVTSDGTFHEVAQRTSSAQKTWEPWTVDFSGYTGEEGVIAIRLDPAMAAAASGTSATTQYINIENVSIKAIPVCKQIQPNDMEAENIDSVSATIKWPAAEASKWNLKVSTKELEDPSAESADVFDGEMATTSKALANLEDNTWHYVYVQTVRPDKECVGEWSRAFKFKTLCKKQVFPYVEDYQSYEATGAGNLPDCSTICGQDADHSYISTKGTGNKALYINQKTKEHKNYYVFPALSTDDVRKLQLNMQVWVGTTVTTTYRYQIGIMTDPNDPSTFVSLHNEELLGSANPYDRSYKFDGYQGDETGTKFGGYIAISPRDYTTATNTTNYTTMYIDNVSIDFIETCLKPIDLQTDSIGTYGAKLIWTTDDKTASHRVRIFADKDANPSSGDFVAEAIVNDSVAIINGLNSLTKYYAYVRKECASNDLSKWSSAFAFKTGCPETRAIPYEEGFEGETDPLADYCWSSIMIQTVSGCTSDYNSKSSTSAKKDGTRGLYLQYSEVPSQAGGSCVGTHRSAAITPALEVESLKDVLIYFDVKRSGSVDAGLKIEAVSDDTKDADAIYITTINDITADWSKAYIKLGDYYTSAQAYKRLRFSTTTASGIYLDNLVITNDLSVVLPVEDLKLQMLTENSIKFSFTENTPTVNQWQVAYVAAGGDIADATIKTIDATEYTIEGLAANTAYDIYVRGNVEGSAWIGPLTATTIQTPAPLPIISGFEDDADQWVLYNLYGDGIHTYPNFWIVGKADSCAGTGENALFITNDSASYIAFDKNDGKNMDPEKYAYQGSNITATSYVWATRNMKVDAAGTYKFSFKFKVPKCYSSDGLYAQLIPAGATYKAGNATLISGATRSGSATTATDANGCYLVMGKQNNVEDWTWFKTSLDIEEAGIYTLALYWYNPSAGEPYATPAAIDSVIVEEYLCTTPKNIEFTNRAATAVSLKWFGGKCQNFEYVLSEYANLGNPALIDAEDKVAYGTLTDGPQVTINNLLPSTDYSFYVRTICEDGMTDWVEYDFNTPCLLEELPYTEAFFETPECWILNSATVTTTKYKTSEMTEAETWHCLQLSKGGIAILPELNAPMNRVQIELEAFNSTKLGAISIGVMDNTWDVSTFKEVAFFQTEKKLGSTNSSGNPYELETFSKMLNLYQGSGKVLAIKNATDDAIYVKDVKLTELPDCVRPQQVEITFVTYNAATVNWIAGVEDNWEILLNDSIIKNVNTNPYRITGLEQGTTYTVAVRALCDTENTSDWSVSKTFQTDCAINDLPLLEDFSGLKAEEKRATLTCWSNMATDYPIEQVFRGIVSPYEPAKNIYYTYMWIANYLTKLGDAHQLLFFGSTLLKDGPKYRWMITPQYAIEGKASLSFDVKHVDNQNMAAHPTGRFMVAISTDNGASWKEANATEIEGIDSVYTTKSVSLDKYSGQNIRVAFYMENLGGTTTNKGSGLFTLLDNIRINCTTDENYEDGACENTDYEGFGFSIKKDELPAVNQSKTYTRFEKAEGDGCDKNISLTLTAHAPADIAPVFAKICRGEYFEWGTWKLYETSQDAGFGDYYFIRGETQFGCDSIARLYLTVEESDTTNYANPIVKLNSDLPFAVDNYFNELKADVLPENETTRTFDTIVVHDGCHFWRYSVTVNRCTVESDPIEESICENAESYNDHGFVIPSEEFAALPAVGETKVYSQTVRTTLGCDSTATLRLTVLPNDTTVIPVTLFNNQVKFNNYKVDEIYTIPYGTPVGKFVVVKPNGNKCGYNRYDVDIQQCTRAGEVRATICEHETEFNGYNFVIPSDEFGALPTAGGSKQYTRQDRTADGCDSTTTLYLNVLINDTADVEVPIQNTDLLNGDYVVDEYFSVPAETEIGADFDTIVNIPGTCEFNKYHVTVTKCEIPVSYTERICEGSESYKGYGFVIPSDEFGALPARLETKTYERHNLNEWGCDSVISLTLTAWNDTTKINVSRVVTDLPAVIDDYYSIPSDAPIGEQFIEDRQRGDGCEYNRYIVMVSDCGSSTGIKDSICSVETSYEGNGFVIPSTEFGELPAAGETKPYYRDEPDGENSCKHIMLELTVIKNDTTDINLELFNTDVFAKDSVVDDIYTIPAGTAVGSFVEVLPNGEDCKFNRYNVTIKQATKAYTFSDAVCEDVTNYKGYGFDIASENMPAANSYRSYTRNNLNEFGVDSIITFRLTVQANDTTFIEEEVFNNELPYMAGDEVVIQAGVPFGEQPEVVLPNNGTCAYTSYKITVNQCVRESVVRDSICEGIESYMGYGFSMPSAEFGNLPAPGKRIEYVRHETTGEGCDSIITLSLKVMKIDTVRFASIDVQISELPYDIDKFYSIPAGTPLGEGFAIIPNPEDECGYRRYAWNITPCTEKYPLQREFICGDADYVAHGFNIPAAELPAVGESKEFTRTNKNELGCDSIITITLTVNAPDTTKVEKTVLNTDLPYIVDGIEIVPAGAQIGLQPEVIIASTGCVYKRYLVTVKQCTNKFEFLDGVCEGENYNGYGFSIAAAELPEAGDSKDYTRTAKDEAGCDSVITLTLIVNEIDTVDVIEEVLNTQLPYMAGEQVVVPAGAPIGEQPEVILYNGSCIYNRYIITVNPCEENYEFDDDVCAGADYNGYGFSIAAAQLPATGGAVDFTRTAKDAAGCDSLITLTLMVSPSEIIALEPLEISVDALPYKLNDYITIPADLEVGVYEGKVQVPGECLFYSYSLTVHESGWGIINVTDDVESIEVYDLLGRLIFTLRQGEVMKQQLPTGVYMLHSIMKSGAAVNSKVVLQ